MGKNKVSSNRTEQVASMHNDRIRSTAHSYAPVEEKRTSMVIESTRETDLSFRRSEIHKRRNENVLKNVNKRNDHPGKPANPSLNQSRTVHKSLTGKTVLIVSAVSLLTLFILTALILPNVILYLMLPIIFENATNRTNTTNTTIYANHCGGVSPYTRWTYFNAGGITMSIDTSNCSFNITPLYYTSITGSNLQNDLTGSSAIYSAAKNGFTIYCQSRSGLSGTQMLNNSQLDQWNVNWVGIYY